jgi:hypothetical protein
MQGTRTRTFPSLQDLRKRSATFKRGGSSTIAIAIAIDTTTRALGRATRRIGKGEVHTDTGRSTSKMALSEIVKEQTRRV